MTGSVTIVSNKEHVHVFLFNRLDCAENVPLYFPGTWWSSDRSSVDLSVFCVQSLNQRTIQDLRWFNGQVCYCCVHVFEVAVEECINGFNFGVFDIIGVVVDGENDAKRCSNPCPVSGVIPSKRTVRVMHGVDFQVETHVIDGVFRTLVPVELLSFPSLRGVQFFVALSRREPHSWFKCAHVVGCTVLFYRCGISGQICVCFCETVATLVPSGVCWKVYRWLSG